MKGHKNHCEKGLTGQREEAVSVKKNPKTKENTEYIQTHEFIIFKKRECQKPQEEKKQHNTKHFYQQGKQSVPIIKGKELHI